MPKFLVQKLVRDKISILSYCEGVKTLDPEEYQKALMDKLIEEAAEVQEATSTSDLMSELADVKEVLESLAKAHGFSMDDIEEVQEDKRRRRGGFEKCLWVDSAQVPEGHAFEAYYRKNPHKYPEVPE